MSDQNKTLEELQSFCDAQQKVIIQLNKKIQKLETERNQLEDTLKKSPISLFNEQGIKLSNDMATEEAICIMQIKRIEDISLGREMTLEETRKFEVFSKILASLRNSPKTIEAKTKDMNASELLKIVENGNE